MTLASLHIQKHTSESKCISFAVYLQGDVIDLDIVGAPLAKELDLWGLSHSWGSLPLGSHWGLWESTGQLKQRENAI